LNGCSTGPAGPRPPVRRRRARVRRRAATAAAPSQNCVEFYRVELTRQRDLLRNVWWWHLLPFIPGFLFVLIGRVAQEPERATRAAVGTIIAILVFLGIGAMNAHAAKRLQRDIDALDAKNT
jgi:hypothetical protein